MRIRLLKKTDIEVCAKLFVESYKKDEKKRRWELNLAAKYVFNAYRMCKELCFVATENNKIIAVSLASIMPEFTREIIVSNVLLVHPDYRRKKVASKLLRKLCIKAENKYNIHEIEANIYTLTNFPISWYESIGFRTKKYYETTRANISKVLKET